VRRAPDDTDVGWGERPGDPADSEPALFWRTAHRTGQRLSGHTRPGSFVVTGADGSRPRPLPLLGPQQIADLDQQLDLRSAGTGRLLAALAPLDRRSWAATTTK
jgi:hypothetical protein